MKKVLMNRVLLGYETDSGLDGDELHHVMSPNGGHIAVFGGEDRRAAFRERFIENLNRSGGFGLEVVYLDFSERTLEDIRAEVGKYLGVKPALMVAKNPRGPEDGRYIMALLRQSRGFGITVYVECESASVVAPVLDNVQTSVFLGGSVSDEALSILWGPNILPSATNQYIGTRHPPHIIPVAFA